MKILSFIGMALVAVVLSATLIACGDDDDGNVDGAKIEPSNSVRVETAGALETLLGKKVQTISSLKVTGNINGDDIICLRQMLCCSDEKSDTWGVLTTLDLSEATIVEGGSAYYKDYYTSNNIIGQYMFHNCENLEEITLPKNLTSIGENAFEYCDLLSSVIIGSNVTSIGNYAFRGCSALKSINIPSGVTSINGSAFYNCASLTQLTLPSSLLSIGNSAFGYCTRLKTLTIEDGNEALSMTTSSSTTPFTNCSIETLYLGRDISYNGNYSPFRGNTSLTTLTLGNTVKNIGTYAFYGCTSMKTLTIEDSSEILSMTTSSSATPFTNCPIETLYLGRDISYNGNYSPFRGNTSLKILTLGNNITNISTYEFYGCTTLADIIISENVTSIGNYAFRNSGLRKVLIGRGVTSIGSHAFASCSALQNITLHNPTPPTAYTSSFTDVDKGTCILYVPSGAKSTYSTTSVWKEFKNIEEIE